MLESLGLTSNFKWFDWVILGVYLSGTLLVGLYVNRYIKSMADYVVANRSLKSFLGIATMVGTELGLVTVMYSAQKGFTGGFAAFHIGLVAGVVTLIVGLTGFIVVPLREMGVMTIPEFYDRRFGPGVRVFGGLLLAGAGILNMGMFLKAGAIFLTQLTGLSNPLAVNVVMTTLILLVLAYTILGGMVSVVITDYVQFVVLSFGMLAACAVALKRLGWHAIVGAVKEVHGEAGFDPLNAAGFGAHYVIWMIFTAGIVSCAVWQTAVMRACAVESSRAVKRLYAWSSVGFLIRFLIPQFLGVCALAYLWQNEKTRPAFFTPEGVPVQNAETTLAAMPVMLSQLLPMGLIGLVGAGMLAAFMSTHDSYLLCWSSVLVQDVIAPAARGELSTKTRLWLARVLIFAIGMFLLVWSLWYPLGQDLWDYMAVSGAIYFTGAFAVLLAGIYWRRASTVGAYLALAAGSCAVFGLKPVKNAAGLARLEEACNIQIGSEQVGLATAVLALVLMLVGSLVFPDRKADRSDTTEERKP